MQTRTSYDKRITRDKNTHKNTHKNRPKNTHKTRRKNTHNTQTKKITGTETKNTDERERTEKGTKKKARCKSARTDGFHSVLITTYANVFRLRLGRAGPCLYMHACVQHTCTRQPTSPSVSITSIFPNYLTNDGHERSKALPYRFNNFHSHRLATRPYPIRSFYIQITYLTYSRSTRNPSIHTKQHPPLFINTSDLCCAGL